MGGVREGKKEVPCLPHTFEVVHCSGCHTKHMHKGDLHSPRTREVLSAKAGYIIFFVSFFYTQISYFTKEQKAELELQTRLQIAKSAKR